MKTKIVSLIIACLAFTQAAHADNRIEKLFRDIKSELKSSPRERCDSRSDSRSRGYRSDENAIRIQRLEQELAERRQLEYARYAAEQARIQARLAEAHYRALSSGRNSR